MKTLILAALFITSTTFARGVPLPTCTTQGTDRLIKYDNPTHHYMHFCESKGISSLDGCKGYIRDADKQLLQVELEEFLNRIAEKVCGE